MDSNELLDRLKALLPAQFAELAFRLGVPGHYLSHGAPQTTRAVELLQYVTQSGQLDELAAYVAPRPATPRRVASSHVVPGPAPAARILFLAANPVDTTQLALAAEARSIQDELARGGQRDRFSFETRWAAQPLDLLREMRKLKPAVVHFSGHGGPGPARRPRSGATRDIGTGAPVSHRDDPAHGLYFQGADGSPELVSTQALEQTFRAAGSSVRLVVLNACYSEPQAVALAAQVGCVVGMSGWIADDAAVSFSIGLYGGLAEGEPIQAAFEQGCAAMQLEAHDSDAPQLKIRPGLDARRLTLGDAA
jgi:hypothetical protein